MEKPLAMIIEDFEGQAFVFRAALERAGYRTEVFTDGADAQARLEEVVPHLVILDIHLPHVSGEKLLRQIRGDDRFKDTRIFLATADGASARELDKKADLVLLKPIGFNDLKLLAKRFYPKTDGKASWKHGS